MSYPAPSPIDGPTPDMRGDSDDAGLAVLAHGLLNSIAAVKGAAEVLRRRGVGVDDPVDERCVAIILEQVQCITDVLQDLMRGVPPVSGAG